MKYFFTLMFFMTIGFAKAQIVNIPDTNFKWALINHNAVDLNNDGEIEQSEALSITELNVWIDPDNGNESFRTIRDITGIKTFRNLRSLNVTGNKIASIDLENMENLQWFQTWNDSLSSFNLDGCTSLKSIFSERNFVKDVSIHDLPNLDSLNMGNDDNCRTFIIKNCPSLTLIYPPSPSSGNYEFVSLSNLASLKNMLNNRVASKLVLEYLPKFNPSNIPFISGVDTLIVKKCDSLSEFEIYRIGYMDIKQCNNLKAVRFEWYDGTTLDFSECRSLLTFGQGSGLTFPHLTSLNIKNGQPTTFPISYAPNLRYVCADESEIITTVNSLAVFPENVNFTVNSYCSFIPGGSYNTITGIARVDMNNNGCDSNDRRMQNAFIKLTDTTGQTYITSSDITGRYNVYTYKGNFTLTPYFPYPYFTISPLTSHVQFDTANDLIAIRDFCIQPDGVHNDLEITFLPTWPVARPGMNAAYTLVYKNRGTTTLSGNVQVNFDNSKMNFISASENVTSQSTGQLTWNYNNLQPFESRTIDVTFNLLPPPANNIGDTIIYLAAITPSANDETAFDNSFILPQTVRGAIDPNGKECLEGSKLDISKIGDYLHYVIHFQNEGTDTAFNIVVADTLSDKLDWNSFEFISSSHSCNPTLKNNKAEFIFENIHLPYKAIDEPGSNGWVAFKIKPKPSVVIGDSLNNTAAIYFDFNMPVITNRATTIFTNSSTPVPVKLEYFSVNKKENTNALNWKASSTYGNASFVIERSNDGIHFSSIGNISATSLRCQLPFNFTDNNPAAGKNYYRLKITDADGVSFYSKVLVVGNSKVGIEITAVANDVVYLNSNKQQAITIKVIAADGRTIFNQKQTVSAGNNNINLQMRNVAKGIYSLIVYKTEREAIIKRFIK